MGGGKNKEKVLTRIFVLHIAYVYSAPNEQFFKVNKSNSAFT